MRRVVQCAVAVLAMAACGDASGPAPQPSRFDLSTYDGEPLPFVLNVEISQPATPGGGPTVRCENRLTAMRLELDGRDGYVVRRTTLRVCDDGSPSQQGSATETGSYVVKGDSLTMTATVPMTGGLTSVHRWYATRTANELRVYRQESEVSGFGTTISMETLVFLETP
jgi:hypothetical protein